MKYILTIIYFSLTVCVCLATFSRGKEYRKLGSPPGSELVPSGTKTNSHVGEPTCEELRAMWRFSKRQSRAAEMTNEIPTFRDPFAFNIWDQYPRPRSVIGGARSRSWARPVYGRIVQNAPHHHPRLNTQDKNRAYEEVLRYFGEGHFDGEPKRKITPVFRVGGASLGPANRISQGGSFQHLKELIWAERAKELQQQRLMEEVAARSAGLKDVEVPVQYSRVYQEPPNGQNSYLVNQDDDDARDSQAGRYNLYEFGQINNGMEYSQPQDRYRKQYRPQNVYAMYNPERKFW